MHLLGKAHTRTTMRHTGTRSKHSCSSPLHTPLAQVLGFSRTVHEDLCGYDPSGAWPVLLDEFVDSLRSQGASCRAAAGGAGMMADAAGAERVHAHAPLPAGLAQLGLACVGTLRLGPVSPHSGSKRRAVEDCVVEEVADQLQHMPLVSVAEQVRAGCGVRAALLAARPCMEVVTRAALAPPAAARACSEQRCSAGCRWQWRACFFLASPH